ncbi:MAG: polysaccharide deacetylase family protein [Myxococcota bacterium]
MRSRFTDPCDVASNGWFLLGVVLLLAAVVASCSTPSTVPAERPEPVVVPEADAEPPVDAEAPLRVHLSFDDAPYVDGGSPSPTPEQVMALNRRILATLHEFEAPASVFFNCDRLRPQERSVELWSEAGMVVGNHTSSHANLADTPLDAWMDDVARCHEQLSARLPQPPTWFRYPYLSQGDTVQLRDEARDRLAALGYDNAHVTVATTEWLLAFVYREAMTQGDEVLKAEVVQAYRTHMVEAVEQGRLLARHETGADTPQTVLFHVNELAADHLADVLADFRERGWVLVGLAEALADPVFDRTDHYVGRGGISWLARIYDGPEARPPYWFGHEEGRLSERFAHVWPPAPAAE